MSIQGFHDVLFPLQIGIGSGGGPEFATEVIDFENANENRQPRWGQSLARYEVAWAVKTWEDLYAVYSFFLQRRGCAYAFRFRDYLEPSLAGQTPALLDASTLAYQIMLAYDSDYARAIQLPVDGTVHVFDGGDELSEGSQFVLDYETGIFLLTDEPAAGLSVSCTFDVPVRFSSDFLSNRLETYRSGQASVPLVEVRL